MNRPRIRIHADRKALAPGQPHVVMLFPFWGKNSETPGAPDTGRFDSYAAQGSALFELSSLVDAQIAVLAGEWKSGGGTPEARAYCEQARSAGKRVIVFFNNDSMEDIPIENALIFRTSSLRPQKHPGEYGLAAWCEDYVQVYRDGNLPLRTRELKPTVGYCGYGKIRKMDALANIVEGLRRNPMARRLMKRAPKPNGESIRSEALSLLAGSPAIQTNFLLRDTFWNGAIVNGQFDVERGRKSRVEYVDNMFGSDYVLCARGAGNFSFRLYETLSCGRIPLFIDTDGLMPFDGMIDWRKYCVWIDETDLPQIAKRLAAFHDRLSAAQFQELQQACRQLWLEWLSPLGFFSQIHRYLN